MAAIANYYATRRGLLPAPPVQSRFAQLLQQALAQRAAVPPPPVGRIPLQASANAIRPPGQSVVNPARAVAMRNAAVGTAATPPPPVATPNPQAARDRLRMSLFS